MAIVTYFLGAGASAGCLPVVNNMAEDISKVSQRLNQESVNQNAQLNDPFYRNEQLASLISPLIQELNTLRNACLTHYSIDTYAKKLSLTDSKQFNRLKIILGFYFTYKQLIETADVRYDNFWASILDNNSKIPPKIKMISWNYDFQMELSFMKMTNKRDINIAQEAMHMISPTTQSHRINKTGFGLLKVNGTARFRERNDNNLYYFTTVSSEQNDKNKIRELIENTIKMLDKPMSYETELKFAWENDGSSLMIKELVDFYKDTEVLTIIGYSFPFFNRKIDKLLLKNMPNIKRIYIQDKNPESIAERLKEIDSINSTIEIIHVHNIDQFVFPKELEVD